MTRVRIDASSPVVEAGLRSLLEQQAGFETAPRGGMADVLLSDRNFEEVEQEPPVLPVVLLTERPARVVIQQGARGVIPPSASPTEMKAALEAAAAGFLVLPAFDEAATEIGMSAPAVDDHVLTNREREVLRLLAEGVGNKEVAWRLKITEHTVKFHVSSLMAKLGAASRTEVVTQGIRRGYVTL